jgi:hypothetical protein
VAVIAGIVMLTGTATSLLSQIGAPQTSPTSFTRQVDVQPTDITVWAGRHRPGERHQQRVSTRRRKQLFAESPPSTREQRQYTIDIATTGSLVAIAPSLSSISKARCGSCSSARRPAQLIGIILLIVGAVQRLSSRASSARRSARARLRAAPSASPRHFTPRPLPSPTPPAERSPTRTRQAQPYAAPVEPAAGSPPGPAPAGGAAGGWYPTRSAPAGPGTAPPDRHRA